jgi:hypothetical protein
MPTFQTECCQKKPLTMPTRTGSPGAGGGASSVAP